jgi:hypothetical protein
MLRSIMFINYCRFYYAYPHYMKLHNEFKLYGTYNIFDVVVLSYYIGAAPCQRGVAPCQTIQILCQTFRKHLRAQKLEICLPDQTRTNTCKLESPSSSGWCISSKLSCDSYKTRCRNLKTQTLNPKP